MRSNKGFTLVELLLSLAVTALICVCVLGLTAATADAWATGATDSAGSRAKARVDENTATRAVVQRVVERSEALGFASGLSASPPTGEGLLLAWYDDDLDLAGIPQWGELRLLHADPVEGRLVLWAPRPWNDYTAAEQTALAGAADIDAAASADSIVNSGLFDPHVLIGVADSTVSAGGFRVERAVAVGATARVAYEVVVDRDGADEAVTGWATRRTAETEPS